MVQPQKQKQDGVSGAADWISDFSVPPLSTSTPFHRLIRDACTPPSPRIQVYTCDLFWSIACGRKWLCQLQAWALRCFTCFCPVCGVSGITMIRMCPSFSTGHRKGMREMWRSTSMADLNVQSNHPSSYSLKKAPPAKSIFYQRNPNNLRSMWTIPGYVYITEFGVGFYS